MHRMGNNEKISGPESEIRKPEGWNQESRNAGAQISSTDSLVPDFRRLLLL
jgi:hypothetical protein